MKKIPCLLVVLLSFASPLQAARDFSTIEIKAQPVAGGVYMLAGSGGNIGVLATNDGLILIDDQFAPLATKIEQAMKNIKDVPLKYIVNTHYHGDHTGGNGHFGQQAPIFAHVNVRKRVAEDNNKPVADLPVVTYEQGVSIHLGNEEVTLSHYPKGHTDGDSVVYFNNAKVLHMGDLFFQGRFPYIDLKAGGSVKGYLANIKAIAKHYPNDIKIIPGHGQLSDMAGLNEFIAMLEYSLNMVAEAIGNGATDQQILDKGIGEKYKSWSWQFINEQRWLNTLISDLRSK